MLEDRQACLVSERTAGEVSFASKGRENTQGSLCGSHCTFSGTGGAQRSGSALGPGPGEFMPHRVCWVLGSVHPGNAIVLPTGLLRPTPRDRQPRASLLRGRHCQELASCPARNS